MTASVVRIAVLPIAGLGTRFLPATKSIPKELIPIAGRPLVQYAVEEALESGIERCVLVTSPGRDGALRHFQSDPVLEGALTAQGKDSELALVRSIAGYGDAVVAVEQPEPLGLGHAVGCAFGEVGKGASCAVLLPDDLVMAKKPCIAQLLEVHARFGGTVLGIVEVEPDDVRKFGILDPGEEDGPVVEVRGLIEKPEPSAAPSRLAVVGRYVLGSRTLDSITSTLPGAGGEIQLTDAIASTIGVNPVHGFKFQGRRFDCGHRAGAIEAELVVALDDPEIGHDVAVMLRRVQGENPA